MPDGGLDRRVAIVTGASSGIGRATAELLAALGASVVLGARRVDRIQTVAAGIMRDGGTAIALRLDVCDLSQARTLAKCTLEKFGRIDILVNSAGVYLKSPFVKQPVEEWDRMIDVNVRGMLYCTAAVLPTMLKQGSGHVINMGSVAGRRIFLSGTVYCATKFAVRAISAGLRMELSPDHNIRVTDIEPGAVGTEIWDGMGDAERESLEQRWAGKKMLQPEDVARAVAYALQQPEHVNVNELMVRPTEQTD